MSCNVNVPFSASLCFNAKMGQVNATTSDYNKLTHKPSINGVTLIGDKTSKELGLGEDKHFTFIQNVASDVWEVEHNLNKYPSVTIVDSAENIVIGDIVYLDGNNVRLTFAAPFSGKAYFN